MKCPKCQHKNPESTKFCGECGTQLIPQPEAMPAFTETLETASGDVTRGTLFAGRYEIIEELGAGGMGKVYRVEDKKLKQEVALKLIKPEIAKDKKTVERFQNELKSARMIANKNVCRMFDMGESGEAHFITMEYVKGEDLRSMIRMSGQLGIGTAINVAKQICEGLSEAHHLGVIHRDLKSSNIMIDKAGRARIMDFGIARSLRGKGITGAGVIIGTPEYMSPEQVDGKDADQRSDIYSLGIIFYEMLTGRLPFEGETPLSIAVQHRSDTPKDPKEFNAQIPDDLDRIIMKCLEKKPEDRYQATSEIYSELIKIEQSLPRTASTIFRPKPTTSRQITVSFTPKKLIVPALATLVVVMIGLVLWSPWSKKLPGLLSSDKPSLAIVYFENNTGDDNMDKWRNGFANLLIDDLSQSKILSVLSGDRLFAILQKLDLLEAEKYSSEDLKNLAEQAGVQNILSGRLDKAGNTVRISTRFQNIVTGEQLGTRRIDTQGEVGFLDAVDELTRMIKADLSLNAQEIYDDVDKDVGEITTNSTEAYRYYSEGRKYHLIGDYIQSVPFMERAVSIDPNFAMAYRSLAAGGIDWPKKREYIQKAFDLCERVSETERYLILGNYYHYNWDFDKAIESYRKLVELGQEDAAYSSIGCVYRDIGEWDKAIEHFELAINVGAWWSGSWTDLGTLYEAKGMYNKARKVFEDYIVKFRDDAYIHVRLANAFAFEGKYDQAILEADKAIGMNPNSYTKAGIYHLQGDFEAAEKEYRSFLHKEGTNWKMNGRRWLECLYRMLGQYKKAKEEALAGLEYAEENNLIGWMRIFNHSLAFHDLVAGNNEKVLERAESIWNGLGPDNPEWQISALWLKIEAYLNQNNVEKASADAEEVKKIADATPYKKDILEYLSILGRIESRRNAFSKAIDHFSQSYELQGGQRGWLQPHAWILFYLASNYYLNGELEAAGKVYENILALTTGRIFWGDLYAKSYYWLGKIHEDLNNRIIAIERYEQFLDLWKNADPGLPEVEDANEALRRLKKD